MSDESRRPLGADSLDDEAIGKLVRETAAGWTMPPVRLDARSWHDRVRSPRARRIAAARGWFGRIGQAATAAVALTVVAALVAVVLTHTPNQVASSPRPSTISSPGPTAAPVPSLPPKLVLNGDVPSVTRLIAVSEFGGFSLVDLTTGSFDQVTTDGFPGSAVRRLPDGSVVCLCISTSVTSGGQPVVMTVQLDRYGSDGSRLASTKIETFTGASDPRDKGAYIPDQPANVLTETAFSNDGRFGFVGWSARAHPVWHSGVLAVDLAAGSVLGRLALPDVTDGVDPARRVVAAPKVIGDAGAGGLLIAEPWYEFTPATAPEPTYTFDNVLFKAAFANGTWSTSTPIPSVAGCGADVFDGGPIAGGGTWIACSTGGTELTVIRRLDGTGAAIGDVRVVGTGGVDAELVVASQDGKAVYAWDPTGATITRVDLTTGSTTVGHGSNGTAATGEGPLAAFGSWLAPTAAAKSFLRGGLVVSPDGSRVYAIGVHESGGGAGLTGSSGVFAFDTTTLAQVAHYEPTADYISLAVSADGKFVYAAGMPGLDASGADSGAFASITVFSTADGSVRLVAGELGLGMVTFASPILGGQ